MKNKAILLIDFDDTIVYSKYPKILGLKPKAKETINKLHEEGFYIIIDTCRSGEEKYNVMKYLIKENIFFDKINENHPDLIKYFKEDSRKLSGDISIDDKNISCLHRKLTFEDLNMLNSYDNSYWDDQYRTIHEIVSSKGFKSILSLVQ